MCNFSPTSGPYMNEELPSMRQDEYIPYQGARRYNELPRPPLAPARGGPMYNWQFGYLPAEEVLYKRKKPLNYYIRPTMSSIIHHSRIARPHSQTFNYQPVFVPVDQPHDYDAMSPEQITSNEYIFQNPYVNKQPVIYEDYNMFPKEEDPIFLDTSNQPKYPMLPLYTSEVHSPYPFSRRHPDLQGRKHLQENEGSETTDKVLPTAATTPATLDTNDEIARRNNEENKYKAIAIIIKEIREKMRNNDDMDDEAKADINRFLADLEAKVERRKKNPGTNDNEENASTDSGELDKIIVHIKKTIKDLEQKKGGNDQVTGTANTIMEHTTVAVTKSIVKEMKDHSRKVAENNREDDTHRKNIDYPDNISEEKNLEKPKSIETTPRTDDPGITTVTPKHTDLPERKSNLESKETETNSQESLEDLTPSETHRKVNMQARPTTLGTIDKEPPTTESGRNFEEENEQDQIKRKMLPNVDVEKELQNMIEVASDDIASNDLTPTVPNLGEPVTDIFDNAYDFDVSRRKNGDKTTNIIETTIVPITEPTILEAERRNNEKENEQRKFVDAAEPTESKKIDEENDSKEITESVEYEERVKNENDKTPEIDEIDESLEVPQLEVTQKPGYLDVAGSAEDFSAEDLQATRDKAYPFLDIFLNSSDIHLPAEKREELEKIRKIILYLYFHTKQTPKDHYKIGIIALKWFNTISISPTEKEKVAFLQNWLKHNKLDDQNLKQKLMLLIKNQNQFDDEYSKIENDELSHAKAQSGPTSSDADDIEQDDLFKVAVIVLKLHNMVNDGKDSNEDFTDVIRRIIKKPIAEYTERDKEIVKRLLVLVKSPAILDRTFNKIRHDVLKSKPTLTGRKINSETASIEDENGAGSKLIVAIMRLPKKAYRKNSVMSTRRTTDKIIRRLIDDLHSKINVNSSAENNDSVVDSKELSPTLRKIIIMDKNEPAKTKNDKTNEGIVLDETMSRILNKDDSSLESRRTGAASTKEQLEVDELIKDLMKNNFEANGRKSNTDGSKADELKKIIIVDGNEMRKNNKVNGEDISNAVKSLLRKFNNEATTAKNLEITTSITDLQNRFEAESRRADVRNIDEQNLSQTLRNIYDSVVKNYEESKYEEMQIMPNPNPLLRELENEKEEQNAMASEIERTTILNSVEDGGYKHHQPVVTASNDASLSADIKHKTEEYMEQFRRFMDNYLENLDAQNGRNTKSENSNNRRAHFDDDEFMTNYIPESEMQEHVNKQMFQPLMRRFLDIVLSQNVVKEGPSKTYVENNQHTTINQHTGNLTAEEPLQQSEPQSQNGMEVYQDIQHPDAPPDSDMQEFTTPKSQPFLRGLWYKLGSFLGSDKNARRMGADDTEYELNKSIFVTPSGKERDTEDKTKDKIKKFSNRRNNNDLEEHTRRLVSDELTEAITSKILEDMNARTSQSTTKHSSLLKKRKISQSNEIISDSTTIEPQIENHNEEENVSDNNVTQSEDVDDDSNHRSTEAQNEDETTSIKVENGGSTDSSEEITNQDGLTSTVSTEITDENGNADKEKSCNDENVTVDQTTALNQRQGSKNVNDGESEANLQKLNSNTDGQINKGNTNNPNCNNAEKNHSPNIKLNESDDKIKAELDEKALERLKRTIKKAEQSLMNNIQSKVKINETFADKLVDDNDKGQVESKGLDFELRKFWTKFRYLVTEGEKNEINHN